MSIFNDSVSSWANSDGEVGRHHANTGLHALGKATKRGSKAILCMQRGCAWWTFGDIVWICNAWPIWSALGALVSNESVSHAVTGEDADP